MTLRRPALPLVLLAGLAALPACREAKPWQLPGWRPERPPQRIVAASLLSAEVLLAIAPRERLAGVIHLAADPRWSLVVEQVQGLPLVGAEPEQLLAAAPDLVICDAFTRPETLALLAAADVPVVPTGPAGSFTDVAANLRHIGSLCHLEAGAEELVRAMDRKLEALAARAGELAAWRVASLDGALHTYGRGSLFDALVAAAGATNVAAAHGVGPFRRLDPETLLAWQPDALVLGGGEAAPGEAPPWLRQHPALSLLPCVQQARLVRLPGPLLATTSHRLADTAAALQAALLRWGKP